VTRSPRARASILCIGVGGIGHPAALALAQDPSVALTLLDDDRVEAGNLHRLVGFDERDLGRPKAEALADCIASLRGGARPEVRLERVGPDSIRGWVSRADVIVEGSDNYATKFLVADACALEGRPCVHGAALGWSGTILAVAPRAGACYRCVFEDLPSGDALDCASAGVFGPVTTVVGAVMAAEALRLTRGHIDRAGALSHFDARAGVFRTRRIARRPDCPLCREARVITAIDPGRYAPPSCS
jgi:molybdopterin/thiamine biosynthesis adenylyltransferase